MNTPIARGWKSYRRLVVPADASETQVAETRQAFFSGAAILFESIMLALDPGEDPTDADLSMMENIQAELDAFGHTLDQRYLGTAHKQ